MPITGSNIVTALHFSQKHSSMGDVKYFSSVPSVLQMMMEQGTDGLELLRSMELVGFGGAALPISIGNELVSQGVRLVSRMGSAECGFLLCSARHNYDKDKEWQFLRCKVDDDMMAFEQRGEGLFELIVKPGWPLREHSNRSDGSFATADLFEQHPSIRNAWRYHSRADAQIALDNGKKFDPSPIEDTILAEASSLLDGVLVFGAGRTYPGALLFSKEGCDDDGAVVNAVWPSVEKVNEASPSHARISRAMLVVVPNTNGPPPLEKSSKGTIMRGKAEKRYAQYVEDAYTPVATADKTNCVRMEDIPGAVFQSFTQVLGRELDPDKDLYLQGVDSMTCNHVRRLIEAEIMPSNSNKLPMNVIYDNGSINKLGRFLQGLIGGSPLATLHDDANVDLMRELAAKYSRFGSDKRKGRGNHRETEVIVLTGATGMLGAHILHELLSDSRVSTTFCLVRAKDPETATERIQDSLLRRGFPNSQIRADQVVCVPCDLSRPDLGLSNLHRQRLTHAATMYIHAAWPVNFSLRLTSFESQLEALYNLLKMAATNEARFHFISSTASVVQSHHNLIPEEPSFHPRDAGPLGYAQSKWVAEQICAAAHTSFSNVGIIRVGQLCGNKKGIWNMSEAWPLMLSTAKLTSCLPDLQDEVLGWFPVDQAAGAILDIIIPNETIATATKQDIKVFHVHNAHRTPTWSQMLQWIKENEPSLKLEIVPPLTWTMRLEEVLGETGHPSKGLLYFWKDRYAERMRDRGVSEKVVNPSFGVVEAEKASAAVRNLSPLDKEAVMRMCTWIFNK
ncbi:hypothetical protein MCOR25_009461 [Pyricularia grisea]|nr:hypothetical protein MCOR25_009461 [Pyricularia grisea]